MSETETGNDDIFRLFTGMDDLIDVVPGQSTDVFSSSLISTKSGKTLIAVCVVYMTVKIYGFETNRKHHMKKCKHVCIV